jgi:hypothetical protein
MPLVVCPELPTAIHALAYLYSVLAPRWTATNYGTPALLASEECKQVVVKRKQEAEVWGEGTTWTAACSQALNATRPIKKLLPDGSVTYFL